MVEEGFIRNPCVGLKELLALPFAIPDASSGAAGSSQSLVARKDLFLCPFQPGIGVYNVPRDLARELDTLNRDMLARFFLRRVPEVGRR